MQKNQQSEKKKKKQDRDKGKKGPGTLSDVVICLLEGVNIADQQEGGKGAQGKTRMRGAQGARRNPRPSLE